MSKLRPLERWALVGLFLLALIPRTVYPVSRPLQWYFRSAEFFQAVLHGDWAGTFFTEHPGVVGMWLSGAALWGWYGLQSLLGLSPPTPLETQGYAFADRVAVGVLPLALIVALGIVWGWFLLRRLFDRRVAWVATVLWALDPFHLANSKVLHLDALLSTLMVLSALWMLIYVREERLGQWVLSAVLGGLALLTKLSALFLALYAGLCLLVRVVPAAYRSLEERGLRDLLRVLGLGARDWALWVLVVVLVCVILWPYLWVQPGAGLGFVYDELARHATEPHRNCIYYRGEIDVMDPGPRFYFDLLAFRTTFLTLPMAVVGLGALFGRKREACVHVGLCVAFVLFYFLQMCLAEQKIVRYLLPVFPMVDVLAGLGLAWWGGRLVGKRKLRVGLMGGLLIAQALVVLPRHPYYGTHYNALLGGPRAARHVFALADFGEGLDLAGQYVDSQPGAEDFVVGTQFLANEMLTQHVRAPVYDITQVGEDVDYLVFGVQYTMRGPEHPRWGELWERTYRFREPEFVAVFDGIPYAWVHQPDAEPVIPQQTDVRLGGVIHLYGYGLVADEVSPGDPLGLTLYWRAEAPVEDDYKVFVHLQGPGGELVAQQDNPPVRGTRPTSDWEVGELIEDPYDVRIPPATSFGDYVLSAGMYEPETLERLPAFDAAGERLAEDRAVLATVQVRPAIPGWRWALSGIWLVIVAVGVVYPTLRRAQ